MAMVATLGLGTVATLGLGTAIRDTVAMATARTAGTVHSEAVVGVWAGAEASALALAVGCAAAEDDGFGNKPVLGRLSRR